MNPTATLQLDDRQRAMLAEMGVHVWQQPEADTPEALNSIAEKHDSTLGFAQKDLKKPVETAGGGAAPAPRPAAAAREPVSSPAAAPARPPTAPVALQPRPAGIDSMDWPALQQAVASCSACGLCQGRTQAVLGVGDTRADWMVIGEAPGEEEDRRGEPFVGASGQLLDNMLKAVGRSRRPGEPGWGGAPMRGVYIANVIKCRPPGNRNPSPEEVGQCSAYLARQVALVQPRLILALGRFAVQALLQTDEPLGRLRGRVHDYRGIAVVVSYHPAYLLRSLPEKAKAWADLVLAQQQLRPPG